MAAPTFSEIRFQAMREKRTITATVLMANDSIAIIRFGPRGGWRRIRKKE